MCHCVVDVKVVFVSLTFVIQRRFSTAVKSLSLRSRSAYKENVITRFKQASRNKNNLLNITI